MQVILAVGLAGAAGALLRHGLGLMAAAWFGAGSPWGTLLINLVGCLGFGLGWSLLPAGAPVLRLAVLTGFLGAFTTFSTFAHDSLQLLAAGRHGLLLLNLVAQNVLGGALVWLGAALGRALGGG